MAKSLQEQLQQAGLSGKKNKGKAKGKKSAWGRVNRHQPEKATKPTEEIEKIRKAAAQKQAQEAERNRKLNAQRHAEQQSHDKKAQARQLILDHAQPRPTHGDPFYFADRGVVLSVLVSKQMRQQLARRRLGLACLEQRYYLIPAETVTKVLERAPEYIIALPNGGEIDDPHYAHAQVPDELIW